ncbi:hypothetical protein [Patulibacter americanus]|uniref:hypothetical protein n=1 Tax=Patulibacter americanus TaxID=588672 RepID=UPI000408B9E6|nr:hypothetical protein [Patulibacter americanus]
MTLLLLAVAGWLVANVLFVVWVTHLSRRGQERRRATRDGGRRGVLTQERVTDSRAAGQDHAAA